MRCIRNAPHNLYSFSDPRKCKTDKEKALSAINCVDLR